MAEESMVHDLATHLTGKKESEHHPARHLVSQLSLPTPQLTGQGLGQGQVGRDPRPCHQTPARQPQRPAPELGFVQGWMQPSGAKGEVSYLGNVLYAL